MLGHCIEMYIGDSEAYIGKIIITYWHCILLFRLLYVSGIFELSYKILNLAFYHSNYIDIKKLPRGLL
jgi:hypothetical protein